MARAIVTWRYKYWTQKIAEHSKLTLLRLPNLNGMSLSQLLEDQNFYKKFKFRSLKEMTVFSLRNKSSIMFLPRATQYRLLKQHLQTEFLNLLRVIVKLNHISFMKTLNIKPSGTKTLSISQKNKSEYQQTKAFIKSSFYLLPLKVWSKSNLSKLILWCVGKNPSYQIWS